MKKAIGTEEDAIFSFSALPRHSTVSNCRLSLATKTQNSAVSIFETATFRTPGTG